MIWQATLVKWYKVLSLQINCIKNYYACAGLKRIDLGGPLYCNLNKILLVIIGKLNGKPQGLAEHSTAYQFSEFLLFLHKKIDLKEK